MTGETPSPLAALQDVFDAVSPNRDMPFDQRIDNRRKFQDALALVEALVEAVSGWEGRDTDGREPCSIERGTTRDGDLEVMVSGLTYEQINAIQDWLERVCALVPFGRTEGAPVPPPGAARENTND